MHSFLITGATDDIRQEELKRRLKEWQIQTPDIVMVIPEGEHITIDDVRTLQKRLMLSPMQSPHTAGVIKQASLLTTQAQQALLKLLEEPPPRAYMLLETESADQLLPTIVSRCQVVRLTDIPLKTNTDMIKALLEAKPSDIITQVDKHTTDRMEAKMWAGELLVQSRALLLSEPSEKVTRLIRRLLQAQKELNVNCNPKLVLDRVFLF